MSINTKRKSLGQLHESMEEMNSQLETGIDILNTYTEAAQSSVEVQNLLASAAIDVAESTEIASESLQQILDTMNEADDLSSAMKDILSNLGSELALFALQKAIEFGLTLWDNYVNAVKYAKEELESISSEFSGLADEIEQINEKLDEYNQRITELNSMGKLSYTSKNELTNLQALTKELELQKAIKEGETQSKAEDLTKQNLKTFDKEFGNKSFSSEAVEDYAKSGAHNLGLASSGDIEKMSAALINTRELKKEALEENNIDDFLHFESLEKDLSNSLQEFLPKLQSYRENINSVLDFRELTNDEQNQLKLYEDGINLIYEYTDPGQWNSIEFSSVFNAEGVERTKDELIELALAGKLTADNIDGFTNLNSALNSSNLFLEEGQTAAQAFVDELLEIGNSSDYIPLTFDEKFQLKAPEISDVQSVISNLKEAQNSLSNNTLTQDQVLKLTNQFPELLQYVDMTTNGFGNLDEGLDKLIQNAPNQLIESFKIMAETAESKDLPAIENIISTLQEMSEMEPDGLWANSFDVFDNAHGKLQSLSQLILDLGDNYTLTAEKAREYAQIFPELLNSGEITSEGLIKLNAEDAQNFIAAREAEINADIDARIQELENKKTVIDGKRALIQAELAQLESGANEEISAENQKNEGIAESNENAAQHQADLNVAVANSDKDSKEVMAHNMQEIDSIGAETAENTASNLSNASAESATNTKLNSESMVKSYHGIGLEVEQVSIVIKDMPSGNAKMRDITKIEGSAVWSNEFRAKQLATDFKSMEAMRLNIQKYKKSEKVVELNKEINDLNKESANIDSQIQLLNAGKNRKLTPPSSNTSGSGGSQGGSSPNAGSNEVKQETFKEYDWLKRAAEDLQRQRDKLESKANDDSETYHAQISALEELVNLDEQISSLSAVSVDTYASQWETAKIKILENVDEIQAADLIKKIEQGSWSNENSIEQLPESVANLVDEATASYEQWQDAQDEYDEAEKQREKRVQELYQKRIDELKSFISESETALDKANSNLTLKGIIGQEVTEHDYKELISLSQDQVNLYYEQIDALEDMISTVEEGSPEYYSLKSSIASCEKSILSANQAQAEWNESIKRLPVNRLQRYLGLLSHVKNDLQNYIDEQNSLGIEANQIQYQQLINISNEQIDKLLEQQTLLKDILKDYQFNSDKYNETASEIQNIDNEISSLIQSQHEWNQAILQIPINKLTETSDAMQAVAGAMGDILSTYDTAISSAVSVIDDEIDAVNDLRDASSKEYEERIRQYQDQLDLLQKQNDERQIQLQLEQAQYDLERARSQKTIATIRNGEMVYEADSNALRSANEALKDVEYNKVVHDLEKQITSLEEERDTLLESYDEQIERLDTIKEKWSGLTEEIQKAADAVKATEIFGEGWQDQILSGNDSAMFESMKNMYSSIHQQQQQYQDQIASNERIAEMMNLFMEKFRDGSLTYEQAMSGIDHLIRSMADGFTSFDHLDALLGINNASGLSALLSSMESSANASVNQFSDYMSIIKANGKAIDKYTSTWTEMQKSIQDQMGELKNLYGEAPTNRSSYTDRSVFDDFDTEDVFHPKQISQFISDIGQLADAKNYINQLHALGSASLPLPQTTERNYGSDVTINMGNIELPDVRDIDGFARAIGSQFKSLMRQEMTK